MHQQFEQVGGVIYNDEELAFAEALLPTLNKSGITLEQAAVVQPYDASEKTFPASTDVGDISWVVPTAGIRTATWSALVTPAHSWQAVAAGGTSIGHKGMMVAAKTLALSTIELLQNPSICVIAARQELDGRIGNDFQYYPLLGDRQPPLDYRD
ncbi:MAG: hypothetical protein R2795_08000 [Saprospiraceae bacterium]